MTRYRVCPESAAYAPQVRRRAIAAEKNPGSSWVFMNVAPVVSRVPQIAAARR
jgi:hypothetical protein